jgi:hypothetical protein
MRKGTSEQLDLVLRLAVDRDGTPVIADALSLPHAAHKVPGTESTDEAQGELHRPDLADQAQEKPSSHDATAVA